ncbi:CHAT domain-containing protein [Calothrix sp. FACHB-156]|nr:CHAT domain-containing protein [Calothrix sp. FACHB-156]
MARKRFVFLSTVESVIRFFLRQVVKYAFIRRGYYRLAVLLLVGLFVFTAGMPIVLSQMTREQNSRDIELARQYVKNGEDDYKNGRYQEAIKFLEEAVNIFQRQEDWRNLAITLSNLGLVQLELGQPSQALTNWEKAEKNYERLGDNKGVIKSQIYQAQALQSSGLYSRSCETLIAAVTSSKMGKLTCNDLDSETYWKVLTVEISNQEDHIKVIVWRNLGDILRVTGNLDKSEKALEKALKVANNLSSSKKYEAAIHLSMANTWRAKGNLERDRRSSPVYDYMPWRYVEREEIKEAKENYDKAENKYQSVIDCSSSQTLKLQSQLNLLSLRIQRNKIAEAHFLLSQIYSRDNKKIVLELPNNLAGIYAKVYFAKSLAYLKQASEQENKITEKQPISWNEIINFLIETKQEAQMLNDKRAESYLLGNIGGLYEYLGNLSEAQKVTQEALYLAQPNQNPDIAYQWQWQMGRLFNAESDKKNEAITNYKAAVKTLESVRSDLLAINSDIQFSFRDNVEPVYRKLIDLLLEPSNPSNESLEKATELIDSLQLAELDNFLRCNLSAKRQINSGNENNKEIDPKAAIFYTILLKNSLEVVVQLPNKNEKLLFHQKINIPIKDIENTLDNLRQELEEEHLPEEGTSLTKVVYDWLIKPVEKSLKQKGIDTLVFMLDGSLRNIPMSALSSDGKHYLIEDYAIALTPSLNIPKSKNIKDIKLQALIFGLSKTNPDYPEHQNFSELDYVNKEVKDIEEQIFPHQTFQDDQFKIDNLRTQIISDNNYSIIHFATHGQFSSDPKKTFILAWDGKVDSNTIRDLLKRKHRSNPKPIELLVLSACKTADGDRRAILGLAGIAIKSEARSTVASLWVVNDELTAEIMKVFYQELSNTNNKVARAEALRRAQKQLIGQGEVPRYWAPYVIVGNWH